MKRLLLAFSVFSSLLLQAQMPGNDAALQQVGQVRFGLAGDDCSGQSVPAPVKLLMQADGESTDVFVSPATGTYASNPGNFTFTPKPENDYFTISPASITTNVGANSHSADFCLTKNGSHPDAEITVVPGKLAVSGETLPLQILVRNKGNETISGLAKLALPRFYSTFLQATPSADIVANELRWNFSGLRPFETRVFSVNVQVNASVQQMAGEALSFTGNVLLDQQDETPNDNTFTLKSGVAALSDPNTKTVLEGNILPPTMIGQYLNYVINFVNTTNSVVQKVVINDEIDTNSFEISSLQMVSMSHPGIPVVIGNKVEVYFQEIDLAPGASGQVTFKIKTKGTLSVGSTVSNKAKIYFDFNFPITTNGATTTFQVLGVSDRQAPEVRIYPNPTNGVVTVEANQTIEDVFLMDAQGRKVAAIAADSNMVSCDFSSFATGIYYLKIATASGTSTQKVVRQ